MPPTFTYPGVYIEELSSGVHTITGVATSIAAFVGWAPRGRTGVATEVLSFSDYVRQFGGLSSGNYLGYAVNQFFDNGGQQAYIIRLAWTDATTATATVGGTLVLFATSPGKWGTDLQVSVTQQVLDPTRFQVQVLSISTGQVLETFPNLSATSSDPQYVVTVIDAESDLITFVDPATQIAGTPAGTPTNTPGIPLLGGVDGTVLKPNDGNFEIALTGNPTGGVFLLDRVDIFNLLCVPGETDGPTISTLQKYCHDKRAFYIVDAPQTAKTSSLATTGPVGSTPGSLTGQFAMNSGYYFPWVQAPDQLAKNRPTLFPPCGFVAGIYARTDSTRGVWKAPAGIEASLTGVSGLQYVLTDQENGQLNPQAINCLRGFNVSGDVVWGARTLSGNDQAGSEWKHVPIRRLALYIESSLYDGTQWVVFEPNDERLWSQIRLNVGAFMQTLFLQGAFQGTSPQKAYFVKCDGENNPQSSINLGIVNILVGFAPLYPAEFVVIQIQQMAGQLQA
jgi:phage tail sheath protein FI